MNPLAGQRVEVSGKGRDEGFALTRLHLGDLAAVQHDAADQLHVEVPHVEHPPASFADHRERLRQQIVERFSRRQPVTEFLRLLAKLDVRQFLDVRFLDVDLGDDWSQLLEVTLVLRADDFCEDGVDQHSGRKA